SLAVLLAVLDAKHEEVRPALAMVGECRLDRRDLAVAFRSLADGGLQRRPVALGGDGKNRALLVLERALEGGREARIAARNATVAVDRGDGHRRILEEAHEPHFRRLGGL